MGDVCLRDPHASGQDDAARRDLRRVRELFGRRRDEARRQLFEADRPSASLALVTAASAILAVEIALALIFDRVTAFRLIFAVVTAPPRSSWLPIFLAA